LEKGAEYREWNPFRSKYCAAIKNGLEKSIFFEGAKVLYLGSAEGTSVSHVSDIVGDRGFIFGVDISETAMQKLIDLSEIRHNIFPIIGDAEQPDEYAPFIEGKVDILFQDVSQRNQAEIFVKNARFLKKGGFGALTLKTKSISQSKKMRDVLSEEKKKLAESFEVAQVVSLEPFEASHYLILAKKK
jgi:fibrillarin-like pre-rRNA processing protein